MVPWVEFGLCGYVYIPTILFYCLQHISQHTNYNDDDGGYDNEKGNGHDDDDNEKGNDNDDGDDRGDVNDYSDCDDMTTMMMLLMIMNLHFHIFFFFFKRKHPKQQSYFSHSA